MTYDIEKCHIVATLNCYMYDNILITVSLIFIFFALEVTKIWGRAGKQGL